MPRPVAGDRRHSEDSLARLLFSTAPFDTPASLAFGTGKRERHNLFVTNLGWMVHMAPPGGTWPGPGLVKIDVCTPGRPLR